MKSIMISVFPSFVRSLISDGWIRSTVINYADSASTAFFYSARSTAEPARAKPVEILRALLRQLCSSDPDQPFKELIAREYKARKAEAEKDCSAIKRLTVKDCTRLIIELTKDDPATIILDALDECEEDTRYELLEAFDSIISSSGNVVKIFASSRDDIDIVSLFYHISCWELYDQKTRVRTYLSDITSANTYFFYYRNCIWSGQEIFLLA